MKRLFVAINLPVDIKNKIDETIGKLQGHKDIRFIQPENWHLTICFLDYQPDEAISPILNSLKETVKNFPAPTVEFEKIIYGPPNKPARMIWLIGTKETSKILDEIKNHLENELVKNGVRFQRENRLYNTHLTLARFQLPRFPNSPTTQFPNSPIHQLSFISQSLDLMESHLKRTGAEYEVLSKMDFVK